MITNHIADNPIKTMKMLRYYRILYKFAYNLILLFKYGKL